MINITLPATSHIKLVDIVTQMLRRLLSSA